MRFPHRHPFRVLGAIAVLILVGGTVVALVGSRGSAAGAPTALPGPRDPAFVVRDPAKLPGDPHLAMWASVDRAAVARQAPRLGAESVARVSELTPEGTGNIVQVLGRERRSGVLWLEVILPAGAAELRGWLPRSVLGGYHFVRTRLVVDRDRLQATLRRDGRVIFRTVVGIGRPGARTPPGEFYVRDRLTRYASPQYGPIAFGTSARSDQLTDWPAGGFVGIHGTDRPDLLPGAVSHGCIRMPNPAIRRLSRLMPIGTPLTIE